MTRLHLFGLAAPLSVLSIPAVAQLPNGAIDTATYQVPTSQGAPNRTLASVATLTYADGNFAPADWIAGPVFANPLLTQTNTPVATGGHPDAYWQFTTTGVATSTARYSSIWFKKDAVYTPSVSGPITRITGGFEQNLIAGPTIGNVISNVLLIRQNGTIYYTGNQLGLSATLPAWYGSPTLYASSSSTNWRRYAGNGPTNPEFSTTGSPIEFGVLAEAYLDHGNGTIVGGLDNWTVTITHDASVPEPASVTILLFPWAMTVRRVRRNLPVLP